MSGHQWTKNDTQLRTVRAGVSGWFRHETPQERVGQRRESNPFRSLRQPRHKAETTAEASESSIRKSLVDKADDIFGRHTYENPVNGTPVGPVPLPDATDDGHTPTRVPTDLQVSVSHRPS